MRGVGLDMRSKGQFKVTNEDMRLRKADKLTEKSQVQKHKEVGRKVQEQAKKLSKIKKKLNNEIKRRKQLETELMEKERILNDLDLLKNATINTTPSERVVTIMKLDNLLSKAFQYHYSNDRSCSDNLKQSRKMFKRDNYQNLWDVHKLRNSVVHEEAEISESDIKEAYDIYNFSIRKILK